MYKFKIDMSNFNVEKFIHKVIQNEWIDFQNIAINYIAPETQKFMKEYIEDHQKRDKANNNLSNNINLEKDAVAGMAAVSFGIGRISDLDKNAPYWYKINFGGNVPIMDKGQGVYGEFTDGIAKKGTNEKARFITASSGPLMFPKKPIQPMNYIEETREHLRELIYRFLSRRIIKGKE